MIKKYISKINKNGQILYIKDEETHQKVQEIKTDLKDVVHHLGISSTEIEEGFVGKWTINKKDYSGEYLILSRNVLGYPLVSYVRDHSLNEDYESIEMVGLQIVEKVQGFPDIIYTPGSNLSSLIINDVYIKDIDLGWISIKNLIPDVYLVTYISSETQNATELKIGNIAFYNKKEYIWELFGWSELGSGSSSKIIFPSMEFEPASGELVISDEDVEDNFDFNYSTGELIFNP